MIAITGSGFIGTALKQQLGEQAVIITKADRPGVIAYDLTDCDNIATLTARLASHHITCLVHTAAVTPWSENVDYENDLLMAKTVAQICEQLKIKQLIYISGWNVYDMSGQPPYNEETPLGAQEPYGQSKVGVETYLQENLKNTSLIRVRATSVYGPGQRSAGLIPKLSSRALHNELITLESSETRRDYIYIDDFAKAIIGLTKQTDADIAINVGSGQSYSLQQVAEAVQVAAQTLTNQKVAIQVKKDGQASVPADNALDITKAQSMGLLKNQTKLADGILNYLQWRHDENIL